MLSLFCLRYSIIIRRGDGDYFRRLMTVDSVIRVADRCGLQIRPSDISDGLQIKENIFLSLFLFKICIASAVFYSSLYNAGGMYTKLKRRLRCVNLKMTNPSPQLPRKEKSS